MRGLLAGLAIFCAVFAVVAVLSAPLAVLAYYVERASCNAKWADFPHRFGLFEGCMIKADGHWIPAENYREMP